MKRILLLLFLVVLVTGGYFAWKILGPGTSFEGRNYYLLIRTGSNYQDVLETLQKDHVTDGTTLFDWVARRFHYPEKVKAGKYTIKKDMSLINIIRILKNGQQEPVNLVITKLRTVEDLASLVGKKLECDSAAFMAFVHNADSLRKYHLDSNTIMTAVFPNTYSYYWNTTPSRVFSKIRNQYEAFWNGERLQQARTKGLDRQTAYILASIVEEETLKKEDKGKITSVYLNRLSKGMKLGADPTVKFALHDFALKRVYEKHLSVESPYNTYKIKGLPPGPICTPSSETMEAVLTAPATDYIYFVAKPDFSGYSNFASSYPEHLKFAREYQQALDNNAAKNSRE